MNKLLVKGIEYELHKPFLVDGKTFGERYFESLKSLNNDPIVIGKLYKYVANELVGIFKKFDRSDFSFNYAHICDDFRFINFLADELIKTKFYFGIFDKKTARTNIEQYILDREELDVTCKEFLYTDTALFSMYKFVVKLDTVIQYKLYEKLFLLTKAE